MRRSSQRSDKWSTLSRGSWGACFQTVRNEVQDWPMGKITKTHCHKRTLSGNFKLE